VKKDLTIVQSGSANFAPRGAFVVCRHLSHHSLPALADIHTQGNARSSPRSAFRSGFTLLELLLAVLVFAIALGAIHLVFYTALKLRNRTTEAIERSLPLQQTLAIIKRDLANLVPPGGALSGQLQSTPTNSMPGQNSRVTGPQFHSAVGIVDISHPWGEIQRIGYFLASPTNDAPGMDLFRSVTRNLLPARQEDFEEQFLMGGVESIAFQYYDGNNWKDTWDSSQPDALTGETNTLPRAIKFSLALPREATLQQPAPVELIVPVPVVTRTNEIASTGGAE
jgi:type II secretion system protein J